MEDFKAKGKTIQEIREAKAELDKNILSLIQRFEQENDVHVAYISTEEVYPISKPIPETVGVSVDFRF